MKLICVIGRTSTVPLEKALTSLKQFAMQRLLETFQLEGKFLTLYSTEYFMKSFEV